MLPMPPPSSRYSSVWPHSVHATVAYFWFWMLRNRVSPDPVVLNSPDLYSVPPHLTQEYCCFFIATSHCQQSSPFGTADITPRGSYDARRPPFWSIGTIAGAEQQAGAVLRYGGWNGQERAVAYEKAASNTRSIRSCCFRSRPGVRDTPEPARVVARWKTGLNGAWGLRATTERASFVST